MTCYNWEHGKIKIPSAIWPLVKKKMRDGYNAIVEREYKTALTIYDAIIKKGKGQRNFDYREELNNHLKNHPELRHYGDYILASIFPTSKDKPSKPKKKDFPKANRSTTSYAVAGGEGRILFNNRNKLIFWRVEENNHACEVARACPVADILFSILSEIEWTRGSGGEIYRNDEYCVDAGNGEYPVSEWGR